MTKLIIARHGNTFNPDEAPTRVGARTDLPLVASGIEQAKKIGRWLKDHNIHPQAVYSSQLKRTIETAEVAIVESGYKQPVFPLEIFNEVDYGPDENKTEEEVIARIGTQAIKDWDEKAKVPDGWNFDPEACIQNWKNFAQHMIEDEQECILVVTSNGIARFSPHITGDFEGFCREHPLKLSTGALGLYEFKDGRWMVLGWNIKP